MKQKDKDEIREIIRSEINNLLVASNEIELLKRYNDVR
jgi:hypothetical protein